MRFRQRSKSRGLLPANKTADEKQYTKDKANICDTPNKCKQRVISNSLSCCNICIDDLNLDEHPYKWGFYEYLENPPWAPSGSFPLPQPAPSAENPTTETEANRAAIALVDEPCPEGVLDDFKKPCCRPCQESLTSRRKVLCFRDDSKHACAHAFRRPVQTSTAIATRLQASATAFSPAKSSQIVVQLGNHVVVGAHIMYVPFWRRATTFRFVFRPGCVCIHSCVKCFYYVLQIVRMPECREYPLTPPCACVLWVLSRLMRVQWMSRSCGTHSAPTMMGTWTHRAKMQRKSSAPAMYYCRHWYEGCKKLVPSEPSVD